MANQKRKPANAKPITSNPLFPAVVALWFGALFGLGSLAVRSSLLEDLVLKSHIDLIIPAAAPPLGVTARILLALVMAAVGAMLGIMLTRRLTRPEPEVYERKRGAKDLAAQSPRVRARDAHPDAPARRPISAHDELGGAPAIADNHASASGPGMLANRRRALAIIHDEPQFVPHDLAPLPGGGAIQPLDLAALALPADPAPQAAPTQLPAATPPATPLDWSQPAPVAAAQLPVATPAMINPLPPVATEPVSAEAAHRAGRQVFGMPPPEPQAPRQIFGIVAEGDHVPQDFVKAADFQTPVFDTPEASPQVDRTAPDPAAAAPAEPLPSPASLGMTDLAARLAEAMRRRRELAQPPVAPVMAVPARAAAEAAPAPEGPAAALPAMPTPFAPPAAAEPAPIPSAYEAPGPIASGPIAVPDVAPILAAAEPAAVPVLAQFTAAAPAPAQPDFAPPLAMPAAMRPLALDAFPEDDATVAASLLPPLAMPAAMRPLALDAFLEDDAAFAASLLPPRHFAMAAPVTPPTELVAPDDDEPADDDRLTADRADNPYASLLGVAPPRPAFVRIDEPAAEAHEAAEPVVIFPGQAPPVAAPSPAAPAAPAAGDGNAFRRFDAPASAGQGQPVAANSAAATVDPAQAEQALRAALSNLQRMSGAA